MSARPYLLGTALASALSFGCADAGPYRHVVDAGDAAGDSGGDGDATICGDHTFCSGTQLCAIDGCISSPSTDDVVGSCTIASDCVCHVDDLCTCLAGLCFADMETSCTTTLGCQASCLAICNEGCVQGCGGVTEVVCIAECEGGCATAGWDGRCFCATDGRCLITEFPRD